MTKNYRNPETIVLHSAYRQDPTTNSVAVPIYPTTAYAFESAQHAADLFSLKRAGNIYTRLMNPTNDIFENRMAELEGGVAALSTSSGQSASLIAVLNLCRAGDNFVASKDIYGGTFNLFATTFKQMGIEVRFADADTPASFAAACDDKTRCLFGETVPNPKIKVFPIAEIAEIAHKAGVPLIIDNTCTPVLCRPFDHGADIVVYSTTKYIGGHGTVLGGLIVEKGGFDWKSGRFPLMSEPDDSYHGEVWADHGDGGYILRARLTLLRDLGCTASPFNSFLMIQGLETLPLRMKAHSENADQAAKFLKSHPGVERVIYPSVAEGKEKEIADRYLKGGCGGLMAFEIKGGLDAGRSFIAKLKMFYHVTNLGDTRSLATHPATTTHAQLSDRDKIACGITDGYIRLSIGLENIKDIVADLDQALKG